MGCCIAAGTVGGRLGIDRCGVVGVGIVVVVVASVTVALLLLVVVWTVSSLGIFHAFSVSLALSVSVIAHQLCALALLQDRQSGRGVL